MLTKVDKLVCGAGVQPVRSGECDDDGEAGDQQEDDGDLQGEGRVAPLVIHVEIFLRKLFSGKIWVFPRRDNKSKV